MTIRYLSFCRSVGDVNVLAVAVRRLGTHFEGLPFALSSLGNWTFGTVQNLGTTPRQFLGP